MTDLHKALSDISAIRSRIARGAELGGYGPALLAAVSLVTIGVETVNGIDCRAGALCNCATAGARLIA